jgi:hypothetical protein
VSTVRCLVSGSTRKGLRRLAFLSEVDHCSNINQDHIFARTQELRFSSTADRPCSAQALCVAIPRWASAECRNKA